VRLLDRGGFVSEDAWQKPGASVDDGHRSDLAPRHDEVAQGDFLRDERARPLVEALVAAANEHERLRRGELGHLALVEPLPLRCQQHAVCSQALRRIGVERLHRRD
jgi:hypothetical protein